MPLRDLIGLLGPWHLGAFILASLFLWFTLRPLYISYRIRRLGAARAHVYSTNPVTGLPWIISAGIKHHQDALLDFFYSLFLHTSPESRNCVEISVSGSRRYIITQEPEHIKTILTSKFAAFGKGAYFHKTWSPFLGDSIFTTDGRLWHDSRALIRPMFIRERVSDLIIFEHWTQTMLSKMPAPGVTVKIQDLFYRMTLDVTTDFLLGSSVDSLNK